VPAPPPIETSRLQLLLPGAEEAHAVLAYFERNRGHLEPWEPARPAGFHTASFWEKRLVANLDEYEAGLSMRLFLARKEEPLGSPRRYVGTANFTNVVRGAFLACHLGYALDASHVGEGMMYEALSAAIPAAFERLQLHRVMANYQPTNERSGRLLRRLGFVVEGYARDYLFIDGAWRDHVLTALLARE